MTTDTEPAMIVVTKTPAPINSVNIIILSSAPDTRDVKMSGAPFPNANIVTPAMLSDNRKTLAITASDGQKLGEGRGEGGRGRREERRV